MRRSDKEIKDRRQIDAIIRDSLVCRVAMAKDNVPYVIPLSFGYDGAAIYLHTAPEGKKIEHFLANPQVCFEFERNVELLRDPQIGCKWTFGFESVIGYGTIAELLESVKKEHALNEIMRASTVPAKRLLLLPGERWQEQSFTENQFLHCNLQEQPPL